MFAAAVIHYDEIALKGRNRGLFERLLLDNVRRQVGAVPGLKFSRRTGHLLVSRETPFNEAEQALIAAGLQKTFGVSHFSFIVRVEKEFEAIAAAAIAVAAAKKPKTFKVETTRSDKTFPMKSPEVSRQVGGRVLAALPEIKVDVHAPEMRLDIDISGSGAFVSGQEFRGPGGLPTGVSGRVVALLSGGIDSPVAAWKVMRRGCRATMVHFHSVPYVGRESVEKVKRLAGILNDWQGGATVHTIPFGDIQREIVAKTDPRYRIVLYRRFMMRIAGRIARKEKALGLVTGDSIGQVASQTLENMAVVSAAATLPIYRPLIGEDKLGIVAAAKTVGTYAVSIEPHDDCCSLFVPKNPATKARLQEVEREETKLDVEALIAKATETAETVTM
ncbi:tRNA 4-thiouridine(8) synthase ThiI [Candidatus Uhrbacteria bacterium]|nr:tRNA 4-thiouridine(8) synthase ThiI [Candidatus Uhrbacteria bacterium]